MKLKIEVPRPARAKGMLEAFMQAVEEAAPTSWDGLGPCPNGHQGARYPTGACVQCSEDAWAQVLAELRPSRAGRNGDRDGDGLA